jgi:flagellar FliL protein
MQREAERAQMADAAKVDVDEAAAPSRSGRKGLLLGLAAMLTLGGGGFYATYSGLLDLPLGTKAAAPARTAAPAGAEDMPVFVSIPPTMVTLGPAAGARHLRLAASLEVEPGAQARVEALMPRVLDVINTYLQALDEADVERPAAMARMRAHLLRRLRMVAGEELVRDLLITEFVLQ